MRLLKIVSIIGLSTVVNLFVGFLKGKIVAVYFGSSGLGIWSQASGLFMMCGAVSLFGLNQSLIREIITKVKHVTADNFIYDTLSKSLFFCLGNSVLILLAVIFYAGKASALFFNNNLAPGIIIFTVVFLPLQVAGDIFGIFLLANKEIKKYAISNILISIIGLLSFVSLIILFKLKGLYYSIGIYGGITFLCFYLISKPLIPGGINRLFTFRRQLFDCSFLKSTVNFGALRMIQTNINSIAMVLMRSLIIKKVGLVENGFFEALNRFSMFYLPLISNILWSYAFPVYCESGENQQLSYEVNRFARLFFILFVPICTVVMLFGNTFVTLLFSKDFTPIISLFSLWFIFELLRLTSLPIALVLLVKNRMKLTASLELFWNVILLLTTYLIIGRYSLKGIMFSYIFSYSIFLFINYLIVNRDYAIKFNAKTISVFCISFVLIFISGRPEKAFFDYLVISLAGIIFSIVIFNKQERLLIREVVSKSFIGNP